MDRKIKDGMEKYEELIFLPHHVSTTRTRMSMEDRAAQFSPFAALNGYEAAVQEAARLTDTRTELTEDEKQLLNEKLLMIQEHLGERPMISVTFFVEDSKKDGGSYVTITERVERMDEYEKSLYFCDGERIFIDRIRRLEGALFGSMGRNDG